MAKAYCKRGMSYDEVEAKIYVRSIRESAEGPEDPRSVAQASPCPLVGGSAAHWHVAWPTAKRHKHNLGKAADRARKAARQG
jgi:hypothetical protein